MKRIKMINTFSLSTTFTTSGMMAPVLVVPQRFTFTFLKLIFKMF